MHLNRCTLMAVIQTHMESCSLIRRIGVTPCLGPRSRLAPTYQRQYTVAVQAGVGSGSFNSKSTRISKKGSVKSKSTSKAFSWDDWDQHRNVMRFTRDILSMSNSRTVKGLTPPIINVALVSTWVCTYETLLQNGDLQELEWGITWPELSIRADGLFAIAASALSLLLVFRTNNSYDRWWEARSAWSEVSSECTHLARQVTQWLPGEENLEMRQTMLRWIAAFPISLLAVCRGQDLAATLVQSKMSLLPKESNLVTSSPTPCQSVLNVMGHLAANSNMKIESKTHFDESIRDLQAAYQACNTIISTPCPLSYTRHTVRFLVLWLTALPFSCWHELGWATVPVATVLAFLLLGIEEIGVQIEEPMGILALETYTDSIETALMQAEKERQVLHDLFGDISSDRASQSALQTQLTASSQSPHTQMDIEPCESCRAAGMSLDPQSIHVPPPPVNANGVSRGHGSVVKNGYSAQERSQDPLIVDGIEISRTGSSRDVQSSAGGRA